MLCYYVTWEFSLRESLLGENGRTQFYICEFLLLGEFFYVNHCVRSARILRIRKLRISESKFLGNLLWT